MNFLKPLRNLFVKYGGGLPTANLFHHGMLAFKDESGADDTVWAAVKDSSGDPVWRQLYIDADVSLTEFGHLDGVTSAIQTQIDGKAASSHEHTALETFYRVSDSGADVNQTSASSTYVTLHTETYTLPTGTWTIRLEGTGQFLCSTGAKADMRLVLDGTNHDDTTDFLTTNTYETYSIANVKTGVASGSTTFSLQFRRDSTGTVTANNGVLRAWGERTA